ncbi:hypothetical protein BVY00_02045 [bacterium G20]|nr:hypothetical protein BVY00_02045 [bacterium G20]
MSLTNNDLDAIKELVQDTVQPMVDKLDESLSIMTANGFAAVDKNFAKVNNKLSDVEATVNLIESQSLSTADKADDHEVRITKLEKQQV